MEGKYAEGEAKGRAEGHVQGAEEKAYQIARSMKATGMSIMDIARYTGLTEEEVNQL